MALDSLDQIDKTYLDCAVKLMMRALLARIGEEFSSDDEDDLYDLNWFFNYFHFCLRSNKIQCISSNIYFF